MEVGAGFPVHHGGRLPRCMEWLPVVWAYRNFWSALELVFGVSQ